MMKSFSIIVPIYNVEKYLEKCLNSLVEQNYEDYEIILVNDGSTDRSIEIIKKYSKKYKDLIKTFTKENGGLSSARNYGIKKATKEFLLFVDSDDYINKNTLKILNDNLKKKDSDILVFNYNAIYNNYQTKINSYNENIIDNKKRFIVGIPSACNKVIKKDIFINNKIEFIKGIYYEDLATIPTLVNYTDKIDFINEALYNYNVRNNSITNKKIYNEKMESIFIALENIENNLYKRYKDEVEYLYIEHMLRNASLRFFNYEKYDKIKEIIKIIKTKFPIWNKNIYFKKNYKIKEKIMCYLIMNNSIKLIKLIRKIKK